MGVVLVGSCGILFIEKSGRSCKPHLGTLEWGSHGDTFYNGTLLETCYRSEM